MRVLPLWLAVGVIGSLGLIFIQLGVLTLWPEDKYTEHRWLLLLSSEPAPTPLPRSHVHTTQPTGLPLLPTRTYHSSGLGYTVCLRALSGSYSKATPAVGFHLACSLPKPFLA